MEELVIDVSMRVQDVLMTEMRELFHEHMDSDEESS